MAIRIEQLPPQTPERVYRVLLASGLSLREVAKALGRSHTWIQKRYKGRTKIEKQDLEWIARVCAGHGLLKRTKQRQVLAYLRGRGPLLLDLNDGLKGLSASGPGTPNNALKTIGPLSRENTDPFLPALESAA